MTASLGDGIRALKAEDGDERSRATAFVDAQNESVYQLLPEAAAVMIAREVRAMAGSGHFTEIAAFAYMMQMLGDRVVACLEDK